MDSGLQGKRVLVTGASGGIGRAVQDLFVAEGARVAAHGFRRAPILDGLPPDRVFAVRGDLRQEAEVDTVFDAIDERFGSCDILVVNAGVWVQEPAPIATMALAQWEETIRTDLTSAFLCCRAFLRRLEKEPRDEASIVLVGSTAALFGEADHADYAAAKAALVSGLLPSLKNEIVRYAPRGRVNAVCPGWTLTSMAKAALLDDAMRQRVFATMPLAKVGRPEDMANAIVWLASDKLAGHVSGVVLPVAGGMEGRLLRP
ncbi:MAG: SDR family oxidoreductase [Planctomycetes bacterium]|nr:SDR family oxidoreductase [Planctomycetota bacterium]